MNSWDIELDVKTPFSKIAFNSAVMNFKKENTHFTQ
jgi:hypothetical protein